MRRRNLYIGAMTLAAAPALAQAPAEGTQVFGINPGFFIAIIAGVLIAAGLQFVLTNLSIASGISFIGDLRKKSNNPDRDRNRNEHKEKNKEDERNENKTPMGVKITSGMGIWAVITASISLFIASLLAVRLSLVADNWIGFTLGLAIWATFFGLMVYLDSKMVSSLLGGLTKTAMSGLKAATSGVTSGINALKGDSKRSDAMAVADHAVDKIRNEVTREIGSVDFKGDLEDLLRTLRPKETNYDQVRSDLVNLLRELKINQKEGDGEIDKTFFLSIAEKQPFISKNDMNKLSNMFDQATSAAKGPGSVKDKAMAAAEKVVPMTKEEGDQLIKQVEQYLKRTEIDELQPDNLVREFQEIINEPSKAGKILSSKASIFDRDNIVSILAARPGISKTKAEEITNKVEDAINKVKATVASNQQKVESRTKEARGNYEQMKGGLQEKAAGVGTPGDWKKNAEEKLVAFFDSYDRPELDYIKLKADLKKIMQDPSSTPAVLKYRFGAFDQETMVALLSNNSYISKAQAEKVVQMYEDTKLNTMATAEKIQNEVNRRVEEAKQIALDQAEGVRKTAASAAWWVLAAAVVSGLASGIGGMLAIL